MSDSSFVVFMAQDGGVDWRAGAQALPAGSTPLYAEDNHGNGIFLGGAWPTVQTDLPRVIDAARQEVAASTAAPWTYHNFLVIRYEQDPGQVYNGISASAEEA